MQVLWYSSGTMLTGVDHITNLVASVDSAVSDFARVFGTVPTYRGIYPELGTEGALFGFDNGLLELTGPIADDARAAGLSEHLQAHGPGPHALAFSALDVVAVRAALVERGVRATAPEAATALRSDGHERGFVMVELQPRASRGLPILLVQRDDRDDLRGPTVPDPACAHAIDHVVIRTAAPDAAVRFYGQQLGLRLALDTVVVGQRMLFFRSFGLTVEVVEDAGVGPQDRLWGVAYRVRDAAAARLRVAGSGVEVSPLRSGRKPGTRVFSIRSPLHGCPTLLIEDPTRL